MNFDTAWDDSCSTVSRSVRLNDLKLMRKLIRDGKCVDVLDNRGWRATHEAVVLRSDNANAMLEELVKHEDTDANWRSHEGESAMLLACKHNTEDNAYKLVTTLLKYGADANIADNEEEVPLLAATRSRMTSVVKLLCTQTSVNVNKADFGAWTALHEASTQSNEELCEVLLKAGAKLNLKDECGITPIFTAAQYGRINCLKILANEALVRNEKYLLDCGANDGATPLMIAAQQGFTECIECLISLGADPNKCANDGVNALHLSAEFGHASTLELLLSKMDIKQMDNMLVPRNRVLKTRNPLHISIINERNECLELMLKSGFPIDSIDYQFEQKFSMAMRSPKFITALGLAVSLNMVDMVKMLLNYGANPNSVHYNSYAPSHCVFSIIDYEYERSNNVNMLKLLLENNVNVNFCRTDEEPNELLHALFVPSCLKLLIHYGLDIKTFFKEGYTSRFLALSLHTVNSHWFYKVLPEISKVIERNNVVRDHLSALEHHIENNVRNGSNDEQYNPSVWTPIMESFDKPHSLKEFCRFTVRRQYYEIANKSSVCFPDLIKTLCVPSVLRDYLLFEDFAVNLIS